MSLRRLLPLLACALMAVVCPIRPAGAQDFGIPPNQVRRLPLPDYARLMVPEQGRPVTLILVNGETLQGRVGLPQADDFILTLGSGTYMEGRVGVSWVRISEVRVKRRTGVWQGILLGGAGGALAGMLSPATNAPDRTHLGVTAPQRVWDAALQGAVIGAASGLLYGLDMVLKHQAQGLGLASASDPARRGVSPANRLVQTSPTTSLTLRDIERSLVDGPVASAAALGAPEVGQTWNGRTGASVAWEVSVPMDASWWLRSRTEWLVLPHTLRRSGPESYAGGTATWALDRDYSALRWTVGMALPIGGVSRLPLAEFSALAGVTRTSVRTHIVRDIQGGTEPSWEKAARQTEWRPVITAGFSLAAVRRPDLAVAVRLEGTMGTGFLTNAFYAPGGEQILDRHRITPVGVALGVEILFPNF